MTLINSLISSTTAVKTNLTATTAPTVNDDISEGYSNGSTWYNTSTLQFYVLVNNTEGSADWVDLTNADDSYKGAWAASTNTPTLADGTGTNGDFYIASDAGSVDFGSGSIAFTAGDMVIYNGSIWQKIEGGVGYVPEDQANKATDFSTINDTLYPSVEAVKEQLDLKQETLVSGTNIKTINSNSILGSGDLVISTGGLVDSVFSRTGDVTAQSGDYTASQVTNVAAGSIVATTVQAAIDELDSEKEPNITATTSADYYRGDKTFATLNKAAVGLANVDNTSDAAKPVSTAQQTALDLKQDILAEGAFVDGDKTKLDGIEAGADITDATNVNAAGATMNSDSDLSLNSYFLDEDTLISNDATKVPSQQSVKAYVDTGLSGKEDTLGFTPEDSANKATDFTTINDTLYPTVEAVNEQLALKQDQDNLLDDISILSGNGIIVRVNANTAASRSIAAGSSKITVANGDGTSGNPSIDLGTVTTADVAASTDKNYVTDAEAVVIGNTSGTNTGDQTITLTGDVTGSGTGSFAATIATDSVTTTKILDANVTDAKIATGIDAAKLADGSVSNTELQYINSLSSNAQSQIDSKLDHTGGTITSYAETVYNVTATATTTLDISNGNVFNLAQAVDITTLNFNNAAASGKSSSFTLIRTKDATTTDRTIAWPASVKWNEGLAPTLSTASSSVDIFNFSTIDNGTTWFGFIGGQNFS